MLDHQHRDAAGGDARAPPGSSRRSRSGSGRPAPRPAAAGAAAWPARAPVPGACARPPSGRPRACPDAAPGRPAAPPPRPAPAPARRLAVCRCAPTAMFWRTVCCANGWTIWKVRVMPSLALRCGSRPVMSSPWKRTRPLSGLRKPDISANSVVLPAPLGPISAHRLPGGTSRLTSLHGLQPAERTRDRLAAPAAAQPWPSFAAGRRGRRTGTPMPAMPRGRNITIATSTTP